MMRSMNATPSLVANAKMENDMKRPKTYLPTLLWISIAFSAVVASAQDTEFEFDTPDWRSEKMQ